MNDDSQLRSQLVKNVASYFDNLKEVSKSNETLCILLDTLRSRVIEIIWATPASKE
jgi:hypothetical protein